MAENPRVTAVDDIAGNKHTEEALRASEERFRLAAETGRMFAYEWDAATDVLVRSGASAHILGVSEKAPLSGQQVLAKIFADDLERVKASLAKLSPQEPHLRIKYRIVRANGSVIWVERNSRAYFDQTGKLLKIVGMVADVTERVQLEEALHQSETELNDAQRVACVGSWQWSVDTDTVRWSRELYRIAGLDPRLPAVSYREHSKLYTPESWERLRRAVEQALQDGTSYELDLEMIRSDGSNRWLSARGEPLRDSTGRVIGLRGTVYDISERKHAEQALVASEAKFRSLFRDAGVGMVVVALDGHFLSANEVFCEYLGYTEQELLQRSAQSVTLAEDWPGFSRKLHEAVTHGRSFKNIEKQCLHKSGRVVLTESSVILIRDSKGAPLYFVGEVVDVTERKRTLEALRHANRRLIEAQEQERSRIGRELHDDINQQLALLAVELGQWSKEESRSNFSEHLSHAQSRITEISKDVQALAHRLHSSKLEYLGLTAAARSFCKELSEKAKVEVQFHHSAVPSTMPKEVSLCLFRVLQEGLQNATKYSGVRVFRVNLHGIPDGVELTLSDDGIGFNEHEGFSREGLGLISMRERLQMVRGVLDVRTYPGRGTTISARVPLERAELQATAG